jgi:hypothetical protein
MSAEGADRRHSYGAAVALAARASTGQHDHARGQRQPQPQPALQEQTERAEQTELKEDLNCDGRTEAALWNQPEREQRLTLIVGQTVLTGVLSTCQRHLHRCICATRRNRAAAQRLHSSFPRVWLVCRTLLANLSPSLSLQHSHHVGHEPRIVSNH